MSKIFKKLDKNCQIVKICVFLASGCSSVAKRGGGGGAQRVDGVRQQWVGGGVNSARGVGQYGGGGGGVGNMGGSTVEGSSTSKNRPSHKKYVSKAVCAETAERL